MQLKLNVEGLILVKAKALVKPQQVLAKGKTVVKDRAGLQQQRMNVNHLVETLLP